MNKILATLALTVCLSLNSFALEVTRTIFPAEIKVGQAAVVSLTVKKEGEEGFAKLMETIPEGFKAVELNSATGNFIFEDGKLRIIWLTMPDGESFKAEYKLIYEGDKHGDFKLDGKFYYVKNGKRSEFALKSTSLKVLEEKVEEKPAPEVVISKEDMAKPESEVKADTVVANESTTEEVKEEVAEVVEEKVEEVKEEVAEEVKEEVKEEPVKSDLVFKVQLGVFSSENDLKVFGDLPDVHYEMVGKLYKYYSGNFSSEFEARTIIEKAHNNGFPGAFLVRFKDGKRI